MWLEATEESCIMLHNCKVPFMIYGFKHLDGLRAYYARFEKFTLNLTFICFSYQAARNYLAYQLNELICIRIIFFRLCHFKLMPSKYYCHHTNNHARLSPAWHDALQHLVTDNSVVVIWPNHCVYILNISFC